MAIDPQTLHDLLPAVNDLAVAAGRAILPFARQVGQVQTKDDGSPLTQADLASHRVIRDGLAALQPLLPLLSEEEDEDEPTVVAAWDVFWCVDPLDGTKEFVKGLDEYTVNIALVQAGRPVLGTVYAPATGVLYWAAAGGGAWKAEGEAAPVALRPRDRADAEIAVVSRSHLSAETETFLRRLGVRRTIPRGSSLKLCAVAEGTADVYPRLGPTCLWDTAAAAAVALEAGCAVEDLSGRRLSYAPTHGLKHAGFVVRPAGLELRKAAAAR